MTWKNYAVQVALLGAIAVGAYAGTASPDPFSKRIIDGECLPVQCGGFAPFGGTWTDGSCKVPGNSSVKCRLTSAIENVSVPRAENPFTNICGWGAYSHCSIQTVSVFGIKNGTASTEPCPYDCPTQ